MRALVTGGAGFIGSHGRAAGDVTRTLCDGSRARRRLGWSAEMDPSDGSKHRLAWHEENRP